MATNEMTQPDKPSASEADEALESQLDDMIDASSPAPGENTAGDAESGVEGLDDLLAEASVSSSEMLSPLDEPNDSEGSLQDDLDAALSELSESSEPEEQAEPPSQTIGPSSALETEASAHDPADDIAIDDDLDGALAEAQASDDALSEIEEPEQQEGAAEQEPEAAIDSTAEPEPESDSTAEPTSVTEAEPADQADAEQPDESPADPNPVDEPAPAEAEALYEDDDDPDETDQPEVFDANASLYEDDDGDNEGSPAASAAGSTGVAGVAATAEPEPAVVAAAETTETPVRGPRPNPLAALAPIGAVSARAADIVSSPLVKISPEKRDLLGYFALVTLFNALAVFVVFVLFG